MPRVLGDSEMAVESTSGGDPKDLNDGESRGSPATGDHFDLSGDGIPCVADVSILTEAGGNDITWNRSVMTRCLRTSIAIHVEMDPSGGRRHADDDQDGEQETAGGSCCDTSTAPTGVPDPAIKA